MNTTEKIVQLNSDECIIHPGSLTDTALASLPVGERWDEIIAYACDPHVVAILINEQKALTDSRTDDIQSAPPVSLQGKLLAFLFRRFTCFQGAPGKGLRSSWREIPVLHKRWKRSFWNWPI